jgi:glycosyltransferase involved in cell wall biosynthesis
VKEIETHPAAAFNVCLTHAPAYGGIFRAVQDFSRALRAPILSFDDRRATCLALEASPPVHRVRCGLSWPHSECHLLSSSASREGKQIVGRSDLLIVHSLFRAHAAWAAQVAENNGGTYWAVPHGCLDPWGLSQKAIAKRAWLMAVGRRYLANAEHVVFATRRERDKAAPYVPSSRSFVVPWPVAVPTHIDRSAARVRVRKQLGLPPESLVLLFVGRLHSMKRLPETINLFCAAHRPPWHLMIAGMNGDITREQLAARIPTAFRDRVHIVGEVSGERWVDVYAGSDAFVSLSFRENFGYSIAEAAAFGLPLLVSEGHDLVHEMPGAAANSFEAGWMVPTHGTPDWTVAIRQLLSSSFDERSERGHCGEEFVRRNLSFERFRQTLSDLAR